VLSREHVRQALEHGNDKVTPAAPPCLHLILLARLTRWMLVPSPTPISRGAASLGPGLLRLGRLKYHKPSIVTSLGCQYLHAVEKGDTPNAIQFSVFAKCR
jgi:hypothetical protein